MSRLTIVFIVSLLIGATAGPLAASAQDDPRPRPLPRAPASVDWPQFHFDASRRGVNPFEHTIGPDNVDRIRLRWSTALSDLTQMSSPAVVGGVLFVGTNDFHLTAIDATSGVIVWDTTTHGSMISSPAVANGLVFAGAANGTERFYALDAATGAVVWRTPKRTGGFWSSPAVVDGVVYETTVDGHVLALDAASGARLWDRTLSTSVAASPAVVDGVVYVSGRDASASALDAADGHTLWSTPLSTYGYSPAVAGRTVFIGTNGGALYALNKDTGAVRWTATTGGALTNAPAVGNGTVFIGSDDAHLYAFNSTSGALKWTVNTGAQVESAPAIANRVVYVCSLDGFLYAVRPRDGVTLVRKGLGAFGRCDSSPAVVNGSIYAVSGDSSHNAVYAFGLSGKPAGSSELIWSG